MKMQPAREDEFQEVVDLLNEVSSDLVLKGIHQWPSPWESSLLKRAFYEEEVCVCREQGSLIGCFFIRRMKKLHDLSIEKESLYLSKIAIRPAFQGKSIGSKILQHAKMYARKQNTAMYLDCWAGNEKLNAFYSAQGLEYVGDFAEEDYFIHIYRYHPS